MTGEWRKQIGDPLKYRGHTITVRAMQPDVLAYVDGNQLPNYYLNAEFARKGGMKYVDQIEEEKTRGQRR